MLVVLFCFIASAMVIAPRGLMLQKESQITSRVSSTLRNAATITASLSPSLQPLRSSTLSLPRISASAFSTLPYLVSSVTRSLSSRRGRKVKKRRSRYRKRRRSLPALSFATCLLILTPPRLAPHWRCSCCFLEKLLCRTL